LSLINLALKKLTFEKIYRVIYTNHHNIYVRIREKNYSFLYRSVAEDDLNMMCRENLKFWESSSRSLFSELAIESNIVLDIGSYTGIYTLIAAKSNKNVETISFEPNPVMFQTLEKNCKLNRLKNAKLEKLALDSAAGLDYLHLNHDVYTSAASILQENLNGKKYEIQKTTLDNYFDDNNIKSVDLIKIDVEGLELRILKGAKRVLIKHSPILLMEALTTESLESQKSFMRTLNYLDPLQVKGDGYDSNNWVWFTAKDLSKLTKINNYLNIVSP
jgi:FkbM family methyltransferase